MFGFERNLKDTMAYALTMKNGNTDQKKQLYQLENMNFNTYNSNKLNDITEQGLETIINTSQNISEGLFNLLFDMHVLYNNPQELIPNSKRKKKKRRL